MTIISMILLSLQTGPVKTLPNPGETDPHRTWSTGFYKSPVSGPVWLWKDGLTGDAQADLVNHGGEDKAVNVYPSEHSPHWIRDLGVSEIPFGGFGENFTTQGLTEKDVAIGDIFELGSAIVQISQPRQ
ncbi:MAG TPA: MOSC domain-containing protein, partial [Roseimicrobium sp.]|nr:MOSC domain-containing protein [Roseimicrobium sp.]